MITFDDLLKKMTNKNQTIAVAGANDPQVLQAVHLAKTKALADFILIDEPTPAESCQKAVDLVKQDRAQAIMKGRVETSTLLKAVLNKETGIPTENRLSLVSAFELHSYHKLLFITDPAINISHDVNGKKTLIKNAVQLLTKLGMTMPKVAMLAAKEKADLNMPVTQQYLDLLALQQAGDDALQNCWLAGPLALDNAISSESALTKNIDHPVAGDADILLCPDLESANILYKSLVFLANAKSGSVVCGASCPIVLTSRADDAETKLNAIILSLVCTSAPPSTKKKDVHP